MDFISTIEQDTAGASNSSHTLWTGLKIRCYIAGARDADYIPTQNAFTQEQKSEIQEYVKSIMGKSYTYEDDPCQQYDEICKL